MNVLVVEPEMAPYEKEINGLTEMQGVVGGLIEVIYPFEDPVVVVCNDMGLILNLPFNRSMEGGYGAIFGTFFVCGLGEEDFCSLTPEQVETYRKKFHKAEILLGVRGNEAITLKVEPKQPAASKDTHRPRQTQER